MRWRGFGRSLTTLRSSARLVRRNSSSAMPSFHSLLKFWRVRSLLSYWEGGPANRKPALSLRPASEAPPPPARPSRVPRKYLSLRGDHEAHLGAGKGASRRAGRRPKKSLEPLSQRLSAPNRAFPQHQRLPAQCLKRHYGSVRCCALVKGLAISEWQLVGRLRKPKEVRD
jgi:hypothetical protein